jgi:hypothetical protein
VKSNPSTPGNGRERPPPRRSSSTRLSARAPNETPRLIGPLIGARCLSPLLRMIWNLRPQRITWIVNQDSSFVSCARNAQLQMLIQICMISCCVKNNARPLPVMHPISLICPCTTILAASVQNMSDWRHVAIRIRNENEALHMYYPSHHIWIT